MSHQADALWRKIVASCATPEQEAQIRVAFKAIEIMGGTGNAIGDLERLCVELFGRLPENVRVAAIRALRRENARPEGTPSAPSNGGARR